MTKWWNYESPSLPTVEELKEMYADQERQYQEWLQNEIAEEQALIDDGFEWMKQNPHWWYEGDEGIFSDFTESDKEQ